MNGWATAAQTFRHLLAHASIWFDVVEGSRSQRHNRKLTHQEIQSLNSRYSHEDLIAIIPLLDFHPELEPDDPTQSYPMDAYLAWLEEDVELSQRVANVWNDIVERGQAEDQDCVCARCSAYRGD